MLALNYVKKSASDFLFAFVLLANVFLCFTYFEFLWPSTFKSALRQFASYDLLSPVQTHSDSMCVHSFGLQMVQLGDPCVNGWKALVGVCGPYSYPRAAG